MSDMSDVIYGHNSDELFERESGDIAFCKHMDAMTREGLHRKSDIAAELAYRDVLITDLVDALEESPCPNYHEGDATSPKCNGEGQMVVGSPFSGWEFLDEECDSCTKRTALIERAKEVIGE